MDVSGYAGLVVTSGLAGLVASLALIESERSFVSMKAVDWDTGKEVLPERAFQWWPETLTDTGNDPQYENKVIPGINDPIVQWQAGGPRVISFEVQFTRSLAPRGEYDARIGEISDPRNREYSVNIPACIAYMRVAQSPQYVKNGAQSAVLPPPLIYLNVPGHQLNEDGSDVIPCILKSCPVTHKKSFPDGTPKAITMSLVFQKVIQDPSLGVMPVGRDAYLNRRSGVAGRGGHPIQDFLQIGKDVIKK